MTAVEKIIAEINNELQTLESLHGKEIFGRKVGLAFAKRVAEQAKEIEKEQRGYSKEQVREMLFMALYELQEECCTTHTKDSIVRKVLKTFKSE